MVSLGAPIIILFFEPLSPFYLTVLLAVFTFFFSIGLGWLYWSIMITKWRIWTFSEIPESDYPALKKQAITAYLIWPDQASHFTKTEIRSPQEKVKLEIIAEQIQTQQELGQLTTILKGVIRLFILCPGKKSFGNLLVR